MNNREYFAQEIAQYPLGLPCTCGPRALERIRDLSQRYGFPFQVSEQWAAQRWGPSKRAWGNPLTWNFDLQTWPIEQVRKIKLASGKPPTNYAFRMGNSNAGDLLEYCLEHGTWPIPIIARFAGENDKSPPGSAVLVEGNHRLSYIANHPSPAGEHKVFVFTGYAKVGL